MCGDTCRDGRYDARNGDDSMIETITHWLVHSEHQVLN